MSTTDSKANPTSSEVPDGWLPELWNNPFTRALGKPPTLAERIDLLTVPAEHADSERELPHDQRKYAVLRLFEVSVPIERHVMLVERIHMVIRQGYKARNPANGWHRKAYLSSAAGIERFLGSRSKQGIDFAKEFAEMNVDEGFVTETAKAVAATRPPTVGMGASGFVLIGPPGMGKTMVSDRVVSSLPETVVPETSYHVVQIPCLKIECPSKGGRRSFCISAFDAIDQRLGTKYSETFSANSRIGADHMMLLLQHLAVLHGIGLIVVDELQHLLQSSEGPRPLINFLVTLVNLLGVPIMLIGTNEARSIIQTAFREARRASGLGQPNWEPLRRGEEWDDWLTEMWRYQWTNVHSPLTPEISEAVFDESQGIIDIAVKLLILAQMRAISKGEMGDEEVLDEQLYRLVAKEEFGIVAPMLAALRDGNMAILATIPDLMPLEKHVEDVLERALGMPATEFRRLRDLRTAIASAEKDSESSHLAGLKVGLIRRGHAAELVERIVAQAVASNALDDIYGITETVADLLKAEKSPRKRSGGAGGSGLKLTPKPHLPGGIGATIEGAEDPIEALKAAGLAKTVKEAIKA
ncbi:ATP-binding protein [Sphingomonas sp. LB2R24]|uniref:ATP-binding protein n=1 Tax=Sphingomonas sorbitolis TaxID=3096165 RepID=UPI002FCC1ABF